MTSMGFRFPGPGQWAPGAAAMRWLLLAAFLPTLTFLGHWPLRVDIPGTAIYVGLPDANRAAGHDHHRHCHADAASCSDAPVTGTATIGLLANSVAFSGLQSPLIGMVTAQPSFRAQADVAPDYPPPKAFSEPEM